MRKCAALLLAACILFTGGCALQLVDSVPPSPAPVPVPSELDLTPHIQVEAVLYFLNRTQSKFETETRSLSIEQNACPEFAIVQAIIDGPTAEGLHPVASGFAADHVEVMPDLINVYLIQTAAEVRQWDITVMKLAMAAALIDYSGVRYVNMLIDGMEPGYRIGSSDNVVPIGAATRPGDLTDEISTLAQKTASTSYDAYAALYFLDQTESWLLPEVVRVTVETDGDIVHRIVDALVSGPDNVHSLRPCLDPGIELIEHGIVVDEQGRRMLRLTFNRMPTVYTTSFVDGEHMAAAALSYTLTDFMPDISGIEITDRTNPATVVTAVPADFEDLIGNRLVIYLPNTPSGATVTSVERVVAQSESNDLNVILRELLQGPLDTDGRDVWPAAPEGVSIRSVLDVYRAGDLIVVNWDSAVSDALAQAGAADERLLLFSVINTLTNLKGVRCVLFLREGERTEYLGIGAICILDPIMKNPGIIR